MKWVTAELVASNTKQSARAFLPFDSMPPKPCIPKFDEIVNNSFRAVMFCCIDFLFMAVRVGADHRPPKFLRSIFALNILFLAVGGKSPAIATRGGICRGVILGASGRRT